MALGLLVYEFHLGQSFLTAGLTLAMLILPMVIIATREAIRAVPPQIREAAYALGATKWQTVRDHVVPYSMGGDADRNDSVLSRAVGETAPVDYRWRTVIYRLSSPPALAGGVSVFFSAMAVRSIHGHADSDVQLGIPSSAGISCQCRGGRSDSTAHDIGHEWARDSVRARYRKRIHW